MVILDNPLNVLTLLRWALPIYVFTHPGWPPAMTSLTQDAPPLCIVLTSKYDPPPGTLHFFHPPRITPLHVFNLPPRMTPGGPLYVLTSQDDTPPPPLSPTQDDTLYVFTTQNDPPLCTLLRMTPLPPLSATQDNPPLCPHSPPPPLNVLTHLRWALTSQAPQVNNNRCRGDLIPILVSDTEGQLYYYLLSTNRYWSHNLRSMSGPQYHLPSLITNLHGRCYKQPKLGVQDDSFIVLPSQNDPPLCTHLSGWHPPLCFLPTKDDLFMPSLTKDVSAVGTRDSMLPPPPLGGYWRWGHTGVLIQGRWKYREEGCHPERWVHTGG